MKKAFLWVMLAVAVIVFGGRIVAGVMRTPHALALEDLRSKVHDGDLIFQESVSVQSKAIQLATHSKYSHCGIIWWRNGEPVVYEAVHTVKVTPLEEWIRRGVNDHFVIKRLKNAERVLTQDARARMKKLALGFAGRDYDLYFEWSDDRLYCSELVWKLYQRGAGVEIGRLQKMKEFDISNPLVRRAIEERYGDRFSEDTPVISPVQMMDSPLLETVVAG